MKAKWIAALFMLPFLVFSLPSSLRRWHGLRSVASTAKPIQPGGWEITDILMSPFYLQAMRFSLDISIWSSFYGLLIALVGSYSLRQLGPTKLHDFVMCRLPT